MAEGPNPTRPGIGNHLGGPPPARDPANPRREIDRVFGVHAPVILGVPIELGHGCLPVESQLAEHVLRIWREDSPTPRGKCAIVCWSPMASIGTSLKTSWWRATC
jgi:hypothetical protein